MEFIFELIFEIILEGIFGLTIKNPKLEIWFKTLIFMVITEIIPALMLVSGISAIRREDIGGGVAIIVMGVVLGIGFLVAVIYNHKRGWKQDP